MRERKQNPEFFSVPKDFFPTRREKSEDLLYFIKRTEKCHKKSAEFTVVPVVAVVLFLAAVVPVGLTRPWTCLNRVHAQTPKDKKKPL